MLTRFGIIGDVHAEERSLARALEVLRGAGASCILVVGDVLDGLGDVEACIRLLRAPDVHVVAGNHERWFLEGTMRSLPDATITLSEEGRAFVSALPRTRRYETPHGSLLLCHGLGEDDMAGVRPWDEGYALQTIDALHRLIAQGEHRWIACGHTHRRMIRTLSGLTILNAGTLYREHSPGFLLVDLGERVAYEHELSAASCSLVGAHPI